MQQRQVLPQTRLVDAEGFIGIRSLRYLALWCDVVVLSQRVPNFVESGLGTGAKRHGVFGVPMKRKIMALVSRG